VCVVGAVACAAFGLFVFLSFAVSILQFSQYFTRGRL
jgi:hypothetical protein